MSRRQICRFIINNKNRQNTFMYDRTLRLGKNNFAFVVYKLSIQKKHKCHVILKAALKLMANK